jgi:hypothetical protein
MTSKEIVDGADVTIIAELDEAAEARIIDVLSKVFVTNKYPGLRAAILDGAERYKQQREMEEKQRHCEMVEKQLFMEQAKYQNAAKQLRNSGAMYNDYQIDSLKREMGKYATTQTAPAVNPFNGGLDIEKFWK